MRRITPAPLYFTSARNDERFDTRELFDVLAGEISPGAEDRGVELLCGIDPAVPRMLSGSAEAIRGALKALILREIEHRTGGWVGMGMSVVAPASTETRCAVRFSIQSAGLATPPHPGIGDAPGDRFPWVSQTGILSPIGRSAFDPVRRFGGVLRQEHDHGDWRSVYFDFLFTVPARTDSGETFEDPAAVNPIPGVPKVILVQRTGFIRDSVAAVLRAAGCSVTEVEDAPGFVRAAGNGDFDLALVDAALPRGGASEVVIRLRMGPGFLPDRSMPLVMLSAHARDDRTKKLFRYSVDGYVFKPVDSLELRRMIAFTVVRTAVGSTLTKPAERFVPADVGRIRMLFASHMDLLREIAAVFPVEAGRHLLEMKESIGRSDFGNIGRSAHCLVSDTGMMGSSVVTEHLRDIIEASLHRDLERIRRLFPFLPDEIFRIAGILHVAAG